MKTTLLLRFSSIALMSCLVFPASVSGRPGEDHMKNNNQVTGGVVKGVAGGIQGGIQGGVMGGITRSDIDDDFLLEPRKFVRFQIEHLLIRPTETTLLPQKTNITADFGRTVSYSYTLDSAAKDLIGLEVTPFLVEEKGIDLKIAVVQSGRIVKEETVRARNFEPVVVELLENKEAGVKLADRITPLIQTVLPLSEYPGVIEKIEIVNNVLIMNDTMLINGTRGSLLTAVGCSKDNPWYLYFWTKGKGVYVLSFWPFEGAEPIGVVSSNAIRIRHQGDQFAWISMSPILPEGKWRVWVRNNPSYDPLRDQLSGRTPQSVEKLKTSYEKEKAAFAGVSRGPKTLERFFGKPMNVKK